MRFFSRSWPLRMTSSMSGGRREPNGPPPPPRLPPPPQGPPLLPPPPPPQGPPLLLFHAIVHLRATGHLARRIVCFDFRSRCIYVTAATPAIKRRHNIARPRKQALMAEITESAVRKVLDAVIDPATAKSVVAQGMVGGIAVRGGHVAVTLDVDPARGTALEPLRQACEQAVRAMPGVLSGTAVMPSERPAPAPAPHAHGHSHGAPAAKTTGGGGRIDVPGVKHIIAVASGKGGVGKSTTAGNMG